MVEPETAGAWKSRALARRQEPSRLALAAAMKPTKQIPPVSLRSRVGMTSFKGGTDFGRASNFLNSYGFAQSWQTRPFTRENSRTFEVTSVSP